MTGMGSHFMSQHDSVLTPIWQRNSFPPSDYFKLQGVVPDQRWSRMGSVDACSVQYASQSCPASSLYNQDPILTLFNKINN